MKLTVADGAVPFVITYRKILKKPKLRRKREFVGPIQLAKNIALRAIEFYEKLAYEESTEVIDPGKTIAVHWAVQVPDPWDIPIGQEVSLVAYRMLNDLPPCGAHFEIISPAKEEPEFDDVLPCEEFRRPSDPAYSTRQVKTIDDELIVNDDTEDSEE